MWTSGSGQGKNKLPVVFLNWHYHNQQFYYNLEVNSSLIPATQALLFVVQTHIVKCTMPSFQMHGSLKETVASTGAGCSASAKGTEKVKAIDTLMLLMRF